MSRAPKLNLAQPKIRGTRSLGTRGRNYCPTPGVSFAMALVSPPDESFPTTYAPSREQRGLHRRTESQSPAAMDPIRSLFAYYVWFTVVYQGKSGSTRGRGAVLNVPPGTYDR